MATSGRSWPRARGPQRGPKDTLKAPRGGQNNANHKSRAPQQKTQRANKKTTKTHPKSDRYLRGFCAYTLRGALFGDAAARRKQENQCFPAGLDLGRCQNVRKHCILPWFLNTRLSRQRLSAQLSVVFCGLVVHRPPARNRKTRGTAGLRVAVSLVWLLGPRSSPRGCPERPRSLQGNAKHDGQLGFSKNC